MDESKTGASRFRKSTSIHVYSTQTVTGRAICTPGLDPTVGISPCHPPMPMPYHHKRQIPPNLPTCTAVAAVAAVARVDQAEAALDSNLAVLPAAVCSVRLLLPSVAAHPVDTGCLD